MSLLEKIDRKKLQHILIISIVALTVIAFALLLIIIIASVSGGIVGGINDIELKEHAVTDKDLSTGTLILADGNHSYSYAFSAGELENCGSYRDQHLEKDENEKALNKYYMNDMGSMQLTVDAMAAAHQMLVDAEAEIKKDDLLILYTYGSNDLTNPEYATALLMFLSNYDGNTLSAEYANWFDDNAASYGFIESFENGYRYVGKTHAKYMSDKKLSLADYIAYLKDNTNCDKPLKITVKGTAYAVYYASAGKNIKVPANIDYVLSGTNEGGIIVTYEIK